MISKQLSEQTEIYTLENDQFTVRLCPEYGNNVFQIWDKISRRHVLRTPDRPQRLIAEPGKYGTPLMLPPNRIRHGRFEYGGRTYQLDVNSRQGHHSHGFLRSRAWQVVSAISDGHTDQITSVFRVTDYPDVYRQYPHELQVEVRYELDGNRLRQSTCVTNEGKRPAPFGYGLHTWFMIDGEPGKWSLRLPCESVWELDGDLIPTGRLLPLGAYGSIRTGMKLQGANMDTVFQIGGNPGEAVLSKPGYTIRYEVSDAFKQWVIYTQGLADRYICLEPYTWVTNAPNLTGMPPDITGFRAIEPGKNVELKVTLEINRT